jgi:hypothetical protein
LILHAAAIDTTCSCPQHKCSLHFNATKHAFTGLLELAFPRDREVVLELTVRLWSPHRFAVQRGPLLVGTVHGGAGVRAPVHDTRPHLPTGIDVLQCLNTG